MQQGREDELAVTDTSILVAHIMLQALGACASSNLKAKLCLNQYFRLTSWG
jgi:hypothetical protein